MSLKVCQFRESCIVATVISAVVIALVVILHLFSAFDYVEWMFLDRAFKLRPPRTPSIPIVVVEIDKKSLFELGEWPWSRDIHARMTADLSAFGARSIVFDIFFALESQAQAALGDFFFAQAIAVADTVYLPVNFDIILCPSDITDEQNDSTVDQFGIDLDVPDWLHTYSGIELPVVEPLYNNARGVGHISVLEDKDGKIRRVPLWIKRNDRYFPQLALKLFIDQYNVSDITFPREGYIRLHTADKKVYDIPVDEKGQYFINWLGTFEESLIRCSYIDVLKAFESYANNQPATIDLYIGNQKKTVDAPDFFRDRFCFIGFTTAGMIDQKPVPVDNRYPLVGIHANILDTIASRMYCSYATFRQELLAIFLITIAATALFVRFSLGKSVIIATGLCIVITGSVYWFFTQFSVWIQSSYLYTSVVISFVGTALYQIATEKKKKLELESIFKRYVTGDVVETILQNPDAMKLGGTRKEVSILFCDIRGFTALSEQLPPEEVIQLLNIYFSRFIKIIFKYRGTIDKFIGDCVMAFWGDPTPQPDHAYIAVQTAIEIQQDLAQFNKERLEQHELKLEVGIGISTGEVVVGNVGHIEKSFQRMEYTVIGDSVNIAARLVDLAPKNTILITEETCMQINGRLDIQPHPPVKIKGKSRFLPVYEVRIPATD